MPRTKKQHWRIHLVLKAYSGMFRNISLIQKIRLVRIKHCDMYYTRFRYHAYYSETECKIILSGKNNLHHQISILKALKSINLKKTDIAA